MPGSSVPNVGVPHVDKLVHVVLYAVLGVLLARGLRRTGGASRARLAAAVLGMALFAAADEWHQRWVPGRATDPADWVADVAGGAAALLVSARLAPRAAPLS